jgi:thiamine-monophosphate kinase
MRPGESPAIRQLGENRVVARFRELASAGPGSGVVIGSGDDAAVVTVAEDRSLLLTCDMMVENVHFRREWARPEQIGWKAMVQNLSDIAAMGGAPAFAVASLAAPGDLSGQVAEGITQGLVAAASEHGATLVGGDLVGSPGPIVIDVALTGWVEREVMLLRGGAQPGDAICVTGSLGASAAGLAARQQGLADDTMSELATALKAHHEPRPRVLEGQAIAATRRATAMMDVSDGLGEDLPRLCAASGVRARIYVDKIPVDPACVAVAAKLGLDPISLATSGGEDYELLFTCPQEAVEEIAAVAARTRTAVTAIGETAPGEGAVLVDVCGKARAFPSSFDHFADPSPCPRGEEPQSPGDR